MREFRELLSYALSLLLKRVYSERALTEKLVKRFPDSPRKEILKAVEELSNQGFLNEYRAVWNYFDSKVKKGWGRRKVAFSLKRKGFKEEVIREVELSFPYDYTFIVREVLKKYPKDKARAKSFLLQRGFTFCEVDRILKEVEENPPP